MASGRHRFGARPASAIGSRQGMSKHCFSRYSLFAGRCDDGGLRRRGTAAPNAVEIMGDDIGNWNISAWAHDGSSHTQYRPLSGWKGNFYDCLPTVLHRGVGIFITGQSPLRTGLLKVGCRQQGRKCLLTIRRLPSCSSRRIVQRRNSARPIWEIATSFCCNTRLRRFLRAAAPVVAGRFGLDNLCKGRGWIVRGWGSFRKIPTWCSRA